MSSVSFYFGCLSLGSGSCTAVDYRILSRRVSRLQQLMQSFKRTQPLPSMRFPSLDVNLVLSIFCDPQYSDDNLSLHMLTTKTVFLLALASGERRSALAACAYPPTFDQDGMIVNFCRAFVPKSYFVRKNVTADDASFQVCPCRTMLFYLDAVAPRRAPSVYSS